MSFADKYKTHAFHDLIAEAEKQGIAFGIEAEHDRIIELLKGAQLRLLGNKDEAMAFAIQELIALIKGEQK